MAGKAGSIFGGGGVPVGAVVQGQFAADTSYLPCDGSSYLSSSYPQLDKTNLATWASNTLTSRTSPITGYWATVIYANGIFVALQSASSNQCYTSSDGISWTARTLPSAATWRCICYGGGLFVAAAGGSNNLATSPDGITWTSRTTGAVAHSSVAYGNGMFVAASTTSLTTSGQVYTSPDGITWTARTIYNAIEITSNFVTFISDRFWLMPSSYNSLGNNYPFYSFDGVNWSIMPVMYHSGTNNANYQYSAPSPTTVLKFKDLYIVGVYDGYLTSRDGISSMDINTHYQRADNFSFYVGNNILFAITRYIGQTPANNTELLYSYDGTNWKGLQIPASPSAIWYNQTINNPTMAYGNNRLVILPGSNGAMTTYYTLDFDTTKFRTPLIYPPLYATDGDRYYIKAA